MGIFAVQCRTDADGAAEVRGQAMNQRSGSRDPMEIRQHFRDPQTLAGSAVLALPDKIRALLDWKQDLLERQKAGEENMLGRPGHSDVASRLKAVSDALISLGHEGD